MTRTIPALTLLALSLTACTVAPQPPAEPDPPVTRTVTAANSAPATEKPPAPDGQVAPCNAVHTEGAVAPGEGPTPVLWLTSIVVTNLGPTRCSVDGVSQLEFHTGGDGGKLPIDQTITTDNVPADLVILGVGEQASMTMYFPSAPAESASADCHIGTASVNFTLPNDTEPVTAEAALPPVCGTVEVTPWAFGGAPGVAPN